MERSKTLSKKLISLVLSLLMVFSCFSGMGLTAFASEPYLTFTGTDSFSIKTDNSAKNWNGTLEYSTDANTWTTWDGTSQISSDNNVLYLRGTGNTQITGDSSSYRWVITTEGTVACSGDIRTLLDYDEPESSDMGTSCFAYLFNSCTSLTAAPELPATILERYCYYNMFYGCGSLTTAPELPATTLAEDCYSNMFYGCGSLTTAPELPATTLARYCYSNMFRNCTSLTTAPELPATTLERYCYQNMFNGCTSLTTAPELPATTLAMQCYYSMFQGCTSLTTAPELPATTLAASCYANMFRGCESLTTAPELPATTLSDSCYYNMFNGCTSLTTPSELPATDLTIFCYNNMFNGCTGIKLSTEQTAEYSIPYSIPKEGTGSEESYALNDMFSGTGGTFTGTPTINTTYYIAAPSAYADLKNTTTVITFDNKQWYMIEDNSTSATEGTVTLLSKECVGASKFGTNNTYSGSTVETAVNNYYTNSISDTVKSAVVDSKMFLLTYAQASTIYNANPDVLKCSQASGADFDSWWLCSPGDYATTGSCVSGENGNVYVNGTYVGDPLGVRPALKLDLSKVEFNSSSKTFALPAPAPEPEPTVTWYAATENIQIGREGTAEYGASYTKDAITVSATSEEGHTYIDGTRFSEAFMGALSGFVFTNSVANFSKIKLVFTDLSIAGYNQFIDSEYNVDTHWSSDLDSKTVTWEGDSNSVGLYAFDVSGTLDRIEFTYEEPVPGAYADYLPAATDDATALAAKVVKFNGHDWYLIEDNSTSATEGTVTLLAADTSFGAKTFDDENCSNKYSTSQVKDYLDSMTGTNGAFADVADAIETVNLTTNKYNSTEVYETVNGVKLYLLSTDEAKSLPENVRKAEFTGGDCNFNAWWLRSPSYHADDMATFVLGDDGAVDDFGNNVRDAIGVRPALQLDLSKVGFNSETKTFAVPHIHDGITFTAWTSTNSLPTDGGNYYLTNDIKLDNTWDAPNSAINLCLDGHSITAAEGKEIQLMDVENGATLNLYDKEDNSGSISGAVSRNGAILVNSGTFNMYGGTIKDNMTTDHGAGVRVQNGGTFSLHGGSIENNKTKNQGGYGGGVHVETNSTFNMSGGSIKNNTAFSSAGVFIGTNCTFNMSGGSITGNTATNGEGGVLFTNDGTATFKLSGDVTISDNVTKIDIDEIDVHETYPSNMVIPDSVTIEVVGALTGEGKIYVQIGTSRVFTNSTGSVKAKDYIDKFVSDSATYRIRTEGDELKIEAPYLRVGGTFVYDDNAADVFKDGKVKFTPANETTTYATLTLNGYQYDGTADDGSEGIIYLDSAQLRIVLQGENIVKATNPGIMTNRGADTIISSENGGSLEVVSKQGDAIYANGALTVESGTISATGANRGITANGINFNGGKIVAAGTGERGYGIYCNTWLPGSSVSINSGITSLIASGTLGAVYGNVANELEGLGWSNITGTEGQETIAVTDEARSLEYKKVAFVSHTHSFTYSASGATITATCSADDCTLTDSKATLTIAAPDNLTYDTNAKAAVITDANAIQGTAKVQYQTKSGDAYGEATETAPTNAGTYKASITVGGATASVEYTIAKADPTCTAPTGLTATYGQTLADVTLTNPEGNTAGTWAWADSRTSVGNVVTPAATFKASFVPTDTTNYNTKTNIDVSVTVAKKEITVSGIEVNNKVYDGTCNATIDTSRATISGALSGDTLTVSANASFADKNVETDKMVYLSNITLGGESASNYTLASSGQQVTTTASITPKEVTISGITANNKVYDGTTTATINDTSATIQGMVSGDDLSINTDSASGNFADKNVGNNKTVTISLLLTGWDAANYTVGSVTVTANITAKEVGLDWSNTELTYNGKAQKPTATATGLAGQDTCTVTVVGEQTNAGDNYTATAQSLSNSNYKLPENKTTAFKINRANQTAPAAPSEASKTINSITLNTIPNGEYKCDTGDWQTSPTFTGLTQNKTYTFRQRFAADANHNASAGSAETVIRTANHAHSFTYTKEGMSIVATCNGAGTCSLTNNKVSFTLVPPTENLVYDGTDKLATLEGTEAFNAATGMNVSADDIVYNYKAKSSDSAVVVTETKNAGTYQVLYTLQTDFPRPVLTSGFTISKANPTCTAPTGLTATYGQTLADVTLTNPSGNTAGTWAWVDDKTSVGNVGTKTFKANFTPADTTNYNVVENVDVTVKVNPADITPTVTLEGWTYGQEPNAPSVSGNSGNGTESYTYATKGSDNFSATVPTNAGNYTVKATVAATTNYNGGTATADFTIAKANITPTVTLEGWTYGDEANLPIVTGNTENGDVTYLYKEKGASDMSCTDVVPTQAGEYTVKALIAETANYNGANAEADFTIAKAKVTITADDKSSKREANLKKLTYKVDGKIYDGDDLGIKVSSNVKAAVAGKYDIKVAYTENANYDVTVVNGTYTVTDRITANERTKGKNKINSSAKAAASKKGVTVKWGKVANAEKFVVYTGYCSGKYKKVKTVKGNVHSFNITKLNGKKLNLKKSVKIYVVAYRKVNGKYEKITKSITMHVVGKQNKKYSNAKAIKVKKKAFTLKVNKSATIKPSIVLQNKKKKGVEHAAKFRYQSTNKAVATVDKNGKIKAVGKGTCTIYIFANNGKLKSVKVTVK